MGSIGVVGCVERRSRCCAGRRRVPIETHVAAVTFCGSRLPVYFVGLILNRGSTTTFMRSVVLAHGVSLDEYIAGRNRAVDFLFTPKEYSMASFFASVFFASVDTAIMGRKTLDASLKMSGGSLPRSHMVMYVFSKANQRASETASSSSRKRLRLSLANFAGVRAKISCDGRRRTIGPEVQSVSLMS